MNARGDTVVDRLYDLPFRAREIALHGVRAGAANALTVAQLRHGVQLADSLTPSFVEERIDEGFDELVEEFADRADAVAGIISAGE